MMMRCEDAREQLVHLVYDELPSEVTMALRSHADACPACARELRSLEATLAAIDGWGELAVGHPVHSAASLEALRTARARHGRRSRLVERWRPLELCLPALCGIAFGALTFFLLRDYVAAADLSATTHVFLGVLSGGLCAGLFHIALRGAQWPAGLQIQPTAWAVLAAMFLTCLLLYAIPVPTVLTRPPLAWLLEINPGGAGKALAYLVVGAVYAAIPFVVGGLATGRRIGERLLPHAVVGACVYLAAIAPGLAVVCAPFGLGIYLSMLGGAGIGGLGGALVGLWITASI